ADAAPRAVVDRPLDRRLVAHPIALGLRTGALRPREQWRDIRHRALRLADRALHAVIERPAQQIVDHCHAAAPAGAPPARASTSSAARDALASAIPSPEASRHGIAPGSPAPTTSTFSAPSARSSPSIATPTR